MTLLLNGHGLKPAIVILALHFPATSYLHRTKNAVRFEIAGAICFQKKEKYKRKEFAGCVATKQCWGIPLHAIRTFTCQDIDDFSCKALPLHIHSIWTFPRKCSIQ
jgi:hypothetical protein